MSIKGEKKNLKFDTHKIEKKIFGRPQQIPYSISAKSYSNKEIQIESRAISKHVCPSVDGQRSFF